MAVDRNKAQKAQAKPLGTPVVPEKVTRESQKDMPLLGNNFIIVLIAIVMIVVGFLLIGGASSSMESYNPEIFSTRRLVVGPTLSFLGFVLMAVAIIIKPKHLEK